MKKIVNLCSSGCCSVVEINDTIVKIGEKDNTVVLLKEEFETLKQKIIDGEL